MNLYKPLSLTLFLALSGAAAFGTGSVQTLQPERGKAAREQADPFYADLKGPDGNWSAAVQPDLSQGKDEAVPVVVSYVRSFFGRGTWKGLKITGATLKSQSDKVVTATKIRWEVTTAGDQKSVLLRGETTLFTDLSLQARGRKEVNIPIFNFAKDARALAKDGTLEGEFVIRVGVSEARFEDGTSWREGESVAFLKAAYRPGVRQSPKPKCNEVSCGSGGYCSTVSAPGGYCDSGPCNQYGCNCGAGMCSDLPPAL